MTTNQCLIEVAHTTNYTVWISAQSTLAEIERFVGIMDVLKIKGGIDPLRFTTTPKRALKARLFFNSNFTVVQSWPKPRLIHPTTGFKRLRYPVAMALARKLQGIPDGVRLTLSSNYRFLRTNALQAVGGAPTSN